ncbi:hypothetical protein, variant [Verruconis gallopava]|nr:hypothetical protein, variant [Verruconis gallopava]KIW01434.1 hypothetical protein, variant [Verruconis gallopava]
MESMLSCYLKEVHTDLFHNVPEWTSHQIRASGGRIICRLVEWMNDIQLSNKMIEGPKLVEMEECIGNIISCQKDIFSFRKDYIAGNENATYNTVQIIMMWEGKELQEAIDRTHKLAMEHLYRVQVLNREIVHQVFEDKLCILEVTEYVAALERIILANVHWRSGNRRSFPDVEMADVVTNTLVVTIPPV